MKVTVIRQPGNRVITIIMTDEVEHQRLYEAGPI